jgi:hypothetical protein
LSLHAVHNHVLPISSQSAAAPQSHNLFFPIRTTRPFDI